MNNQSVDQITDPDLRLSYVALQRAVKRAHAVARATGTTVVVSHNGVIEHRQLDPAENSTPYPAE